MATKTIREKLRERLRASESNIEQLANIIEKYELKITIRNFDDHGLVLKDRKGKTVRILEGQLRETSIHTGYPHTDIAIIYVEGLLAGWIESSKMSDLSDRMSVDLKSLNVMPEEFVFKQGCDHMSVHGGITDGLGWDCLGCNQRLVFNE